CPCLRSRLRTPMHPRAASRPTKATTTTSGAAAASTSRSRAGWRRSSKSRSWCDSRSSSPGSARVSSWPRSRRSSVSTWRGD
ncbi:MAG: hypothetical protein AVDCRST_MAG67-3872, partial [uncultured Solirubrobacteraceae bacterium]